MSVTGYLMKTIGWIINIKNRLNKSHFDKPSFCISGWGRVGMDGDLRIKVVDKENGYFIVEKVLFETVDGAKTELNYRHLVSKNTITLPKVDHFYGVKGNIIIYFKLKNNSRFSAKSPEIITSPQKFNEELEVEMPLDITSRIHEIYFT